MAQWYTFFMESDSSAVREMKLSNRIVVLLVLLLAAQQLFAPHKAWGILLVGLGGALVLSFFWARSLTRGLDFERDTRTSLAQVGDQLQERFVLTNRGRFPALWVAVVDHSNFPRYQVNIARFIRGESVRRWLKGTACYKRGLYSLGPTDLEAGDPFGFFQVRIHYPNEQSMLVIPPVIPLPSIEIATGERVGEGGTKVNTMTRTVTSAGVRDYSSGDSLFSVHWLTSARKDDLYVRVFDRIPTSDWWVFLDMDAAVQVGEDLETTDEYAIIVAAAIANRGLRNSRAVGLVAHGAERVWLPPQTGSGQRWEILRSLAVLQRGEVPLFNLLADSQRTLGRSTSAIVITPSISQDWLEAILMLRMRDIRVTVLLLDPHAFGGEGDTQPVLAKLASWGMNYYRITPEIYEQPLARDYFVWQKSSHGRSSSSSFTASDLDWGKFK